MAGTLANKILQIQQKNPKKVIGLMSGTSADGIDACLVEISGNGIHTKIHILDFETYPYDNATRTAIFETCNLTTGTVDKVCYLNFYLGKLFANAAKSLVKKTSASLADIDFIGSHGQTIYHLPDKAIIDTTCDLKKDLWGLPFLPSTLQIGEPSVIAQETGITDRKSVV